jgi:alkylhydroperoxidase family enzyme
MDTLPGPYTLDNLIAEARTQLPHLARHRHHLLSGFTGRQKLPARQRLAVHLRAARVLGCPVCAKLFPPLAVREGIGHDEIERIAAGEVADLPEDLAAAVVWAEAVLDGRGDAPASVPDAALALSEAQRDHLQYMMRVERLVHATGLLFLPHSWITRAAGV